MEYPVVRYRTTEHINYLELDCWDGLCRGIVFDDAAAAARALTPGRAEFDCSAITNGFLPRGAHLVSRAGFSPTLVGEKAIAALTQRVAESSYITPETDLAARRLNPRASKIYNSLSASLRNE